MVNHFPNISVLTTKIGLLESLRALQHLQQSTGMRCVSCSEYHYHISSASSLHTHIHAYTHTHIHTCRGVKPSSFLPETYRLDKDNELSEFNRVYCCGDLWICKPTGANQVAGRMLCLLLWITDCAAGQGKGIFLVRDLQQITERLEEDRRNCKIASRPTPRIVQR